MPHVVPPVHVRAEPPLHPPVEHRCVQPTNDAARPRILFDGLLLISELQRGQDSAGGGRAFNWAEGVDTAPLARPPV